jgi:glutathione S-transferase
MPGSLKLFGFDCPFVERTRLLLDFKGIEYEYINMKDFNPKPQWFLDMNPQGKVPVLVHQDQAIYESAIINEYLEEIFPSPAALPESAAQRAFCRILIDYCGKSFAAAQFALLMNQEEEGAEQLMDNTVNSWRWLNDFLLQHSPDGDFAFNELGMADFSFIPFFRRYAALRYYRHFELPVTKDFERVTRWHDAVMKHPLTGKVGLPEEHIIKLYHTHSQGWGAGRLPPKGQQNSLDPTIPFDDRAMPPRPPRDYWLASNDLG